MAEPARRSVAAIVPTLNEAAAITDVVAGLRRAGADCVIVVDSGSVDGTPEVAAAAGATVVSEPVRGYGRACSRGAETVAEIGNTEYLAFLDGDGSCDPADLPALAEAAAGADLVLGVRPRSRVEHGALPWHAAAGNRLVAMAIWLRTGRLPADLPPFKLIRAAAFARLRIDASGYAWTAQLIALALHDRELTVREVPVAFRRRRGGESKVSGRLVPSVRAGFQMLRAVLGMTAVAPRLFLMAKAPGEGRAKTRLAPDLGEHLTAEFWQACLADIGRSLHGTASANALEPVAMVPADDRVRVSRLIGAGWGSLVQEAPGLGAALTEAFTSSARRGCPFAIAVSADNPSLPPSLIEQAVRALDRGDAVLGPCPDGGYYLVGLRLRDRDLGERLTRVFQLVEDATTSVLERTETALVANGWRPVRLSPWADVDNLADLRSLAMELAGHPTRAPVTADWIRRHAGVLDRASA